jgi:serine/threonine-protein kinase RIO1
VGGLSERVSRFYLRQVCEAVLFVAEKTAAIHSNLSLENVLLQANHNCLVIGWTNSLNHKRDAAFALAEMAVSMVTGRRPFVSKDIKHDQLGKFLTEDRIAKFWELIDKAAKRSNKGFTGFSEDFRAAVGALFLQKLTNLQQLHNEFLAKSPTTLEDIHK